MLSQSRKDYESVDCLGNLTQEKPRLPSCRIKRVRCIAGILAALRAPNKTV
jgi:hypothetical protein